MSSGHPEERPAARLRRRPLAQAVPARPGAQGRRSVAGTLTEPSTLLAIVNPAASQGAAGRRWPRLAPLLLGRFPDLTIRTTQAPGDAERWAAEWTAGHSDRGVLAYGGDGTVHEVVNGLLIGGGSARLGIIPAGTGNDVARNTGIPAEAEMAVARLTPERPRPVDAARIRFHTREGLSRTRFFINSTSVGVSPAANHIAARIRRVLPGKICYALAGVLALIAESAGSYTVRCGEVTLHGGPALNLTLANGASFGGGMRISPASVVSDGALDLVVIGAIGRIRALLALSRLYAGTHVRMRGIRVVPARAPVHITRTDHPLLIEADGEEFEAGNALWVDVLAGAVQLL